MDKGEKRFEILSKANTLLLSGKEPEAIIQKIAESVMRYLNCDVFFNYVFDEIQGRLRLNAYGGISEEIAKEIEWLDKGEAICGCVARDGCRIVSTDVQYNGDIRADLVRSMGVQAYACHPLHIRDRTIGTLSFGTKSRKRFDENELALMSTITDQVSVAIKRKKNEEALFAAYKEIQIQSEEMQDQNKELEKAYEALSESEKLYRMLFTNMTEGFVLAEVLYDNDDKPYDYRYLKINPAYEIQTGLKREQVLGKSILELFSNPNPIQMKKLGEVALSGQPTHFEFFSQTLDKYFEVYLFSPEKGKIAAISRDITERKRTGAELEKLMISVQQEKERLSALVKSIPDEVWFADSQKKVTLINPAVLKEFGSDTFDNPDIEAIAGNSEVYRPDGTPRPVDEAPPLLALKGEIIKNQDEIVRTPASGELRFRQVSAVPVKDSNGNIIGSVSVVRDITELKQAEQELKESKAQLSAFLEQLPVGLGLADTQGRLLVSNSIFRSFKGDIVLSKSGNCWRWRAWGADGHLLERSEWPFERAFQGERVNPGLDFLYTTDNGREIWTRVSAVPFKNEIGEIKGAVSVIENIDKQKRAEEALKRAHDYLEEKVKERTAELEEAYNSLLENELRLNEAQRIAHLGNWDWNIQNGRIYWSDEIYHIFGLDPLEIVPTYNEFLNYVHPDDRDHMNKTVKEVFSGKPSGIDCRIISADRGERVISTYGEAIFDEKGTPIRIRGTVQDITERKKAEEKVKESESKLKTLFELLPVGVSIIDKKRNLVDANLALEKILGLSRSDLLRGKHTTRKYIKSSGTEMLYEDFPSVKAWEEKGSIQNADIGIIKEDGSVGWTAVSATSLPFDNDQVVIITRDITERKMAEESMKRLEITRKQEIHHRIKNNLQVISSLLDLQADQFNDKVDIKYSEVLEAFKESQDRVISMSLIHEELYEGEEIDTLNFSSYLGKLSENLFSTYNVEGEDISLTMDLEKNVLLDMDTAVPLGIIVNELISNSLKHAFPEKIKGEIQIKLFSDRLRKKEVNGETFTKKNTVYTLIISDNGIGIPESIDFKNTDTLGLQLVNILVDQLEGQMELKRDKGAEFIIIFSVEEREN